MSHLLIWGNAYAQIIRDGGGQVLGLYPLLPDRVEVDRDDKGEIFYVYDRYSDENPNFGEYGRVCLRQEDVLHIPGLGFDGLVGYSPIAMAKNAGKVAVLEEGMKYQQIGVPPHMVGDFLRKCLDEHDGESGAAGDVCGDAERGEFGDDLYSGVCGRYAAG